MLRKPLPKTYAQRLTLSQPAAEAIAYAGLTMLAGEPERMARFFSLSGIDPAEIRQLAGTPAFQASVLDHIRGDESLLLAFCANQNIDPLDVGRAEALLSGRRHE